MTETNKFPLISGHISFDLVNTELVRRGQRQDLLLSAEDMLDWFHVIKEDNAFWDEKLFLKIKKRNAQIMLAMLEMRDVLREHFESIADGQPIANDFIAFLEKKIEVAPFTYQLMNQKLIAIPVGEVEDIFLSIIAYDVLALIDENKLSLLKRCANADCVLLFLDESGRRKWCSMKICGNRKKVARYQYRNSDDE